jgi:apolipoprotein N-acyltransferase
MARALVERGANFLVVITNDAWYGLSAGATNHHNVSLLRAVENRRYVLRDANTGISSIIAPSGRITATLGLDQRGFVEGEIHPLVSQENTVFTIWGNAWLALPGLILLGLFVLTNHARRLALPVSEETV